MRTIGFLIVIALTASWGDGQEWTGFRGNDGRGVLDNVESLSSSSELELRVRWKIKLGSGYSSVVVAQNHAITMYCDQDQDYVASLDTGTGEMQWRTPVGERFQGENGSFDGPISTPLIVDGKVFALDPSGKLVCLKLSDGNELWSTHLVDDLGSRRPMYGFATSPIFAQGNLILQTGVKDGSLAALNPVDGKVVWTATNDSINSQSPVSIDLDGENLILAAGGKLLCGVDAETGDPVFEYPHGGGNGSAMVPVPLPDGGVLLTLDDAFSKAVSLKSYDDDKVNVSDEWQDRSIKNTYNVPVFCNDHLFAYSTRILTCVDPATGRPKWKSRKPGDGFVIAVNDHLIINTKKGSLHLALASPEKFNEVAGIELFDDLVWSLPAFSDGAIFCRSLKEVACVEVVQSGAPEIAESETLQPVGPRFASLVESVQSKESTADRQTVVDQFMSELETLPWIEDDIVHFLYQGDETDVAVASDIFGARQEKQMRRVSDTDLFVYSMRLPVDQRANYVFLVNYKPQLDPRNERQTTSSMYAGEMEFAVRLRGEKPLEMSWFSMPEWSEPPYLKGVANEISGTILEHKLDESNEAVQAEVYLPKSYGESDQSYRTIYFFTDPSHKTVGKLIPTIERIWSMDTGIEPAILVFPRFAPFGQKPVSLTEDLIPSIEKKYRVKTDRMSRSCVGFGMLAGGALNPAFENPDWIGNVAAYSPMIFDAGMRQLEAATKELDLPMNVYIEWGRFDMFNPHENWDVRTIAERIYRQCKGKPSIDLSGGMVNDSADWSSWRNRFVKFLKR